MSAVVVENELSGRELDVAVAERVMGWQRWQLAEGVRLHSPSAAEWLPVLSPSATLTDAPYTSVGAMPRYSEDIAAAMEVTSRMESLNYQWQFSRTNPVKSIHDNLPHAEFWTYKVGVLQPIGMATAPTLAEAICRAALAAVNTQESKSSEASGEARETR